MSLGPIKNDPSPNPSLKQAVPVKSGSQADKLRQACQDFESIFLQQILKEGRQSVAALSTETPSFDREVYEGWQDEQFAKSMTGAGGIGLAETLYRQLAGPAAQPAPADRSDSKK